MAAKINSKDFTVKAGGSLKATNGKRYEIKNGKLSKVKDLSDIGKLSIDLAADYKKLTSDLWRYIKDKETLNKLVDVTYKNGYVLYRRYKMQYTANGFLLSDYSSNRKIPHQLEPFPTAQQVYELVSKMGIDKVALQKKKQEQEVKVNQLVQRIAKEVSPKNHVRVSTKVAKNMYNELLRDKGISLELRQEYSEKLMTKYPYLQSREDVDVSAVRKKALNYIKNHDEIDTIIVKLTRFIPNISFNIFFNRLVKQYKQKKIRGLVFKEMLSEFIAKDSNFEKKRYKPAPKFIPKEMFEIDEIVSIENGMVTFINDKTGTTTVSKTEIVLYDLLHIEPRYHVAVCKYLKGEMTIEQITKTSLIRDKFVCLDYKDIVHDEKLYEWAEDLLLEYESHNPLDVFYRNEIKFEIGTKLVIKFPGFYQKKKATVHKYKQGWQVRYEDGTVEYLFKGVYYEIQKE